MNLIDSFLKRFVYFSTTVFLSVRHANVQAADEINQSAAHMYLVDPSQEDRAYGGQHNDSLCQVYRFPSMRFVIQGQHVYQPNMQPPTGAHTYRSCLRLA